MRTHTPFSRWIDEYLAVRRQAGFALKVEEEELRRFARFTEASESCRSFNRTTCRPVGEQFQQWTSADCGTQDRSAPTFFSLLSPV